MNRAAKVALLSTLIVRPGLWDAQCEEWARLLPHDSPVEHAARLTSMVNSGNAHSLDLMDGPHRVGVLVYSVDSRISPPEFVIHAAYSPAGFLDLTEAYLPKFRAIAHDIGCGTLRFNTVRPALVEKALAQGGAISEVIIRFHV